MIFPGLKKLRDQLGFKDNGTICYGFFKNSFFSFADGRNIKLLCIRTPEVLDDEDKEKIKTWEKKGYASQVSFSEDPSRYAEITFPEKFWPFKVSKIKEVIEDIANYIANKYPNSEVKCSYCDNAATPDVKVRVYEMNGEPMPLCEACASQIQKGLNEEKENLDRQPDNYLRGAATGAIFSIPGILASVFFFALGKIAGVTGLVYYALALKGYSWAKGKLDKTGIVIVSIISLVFSILGTYVGYAIDIARQLADNPDFCEDSFIERFSVSFDIMEIPEVHTELNKNLAVTLIVCGICIVVQMYTIWRTLPTSKVKKLD